MLLILALLALSRWRQALDAEAARVATLEDPVLLDKAGRPVMQGAVAVRTPHADKAALARTEALHATWARHWRRCALALALVFALVLSSYVGAVASEAASRDALAGCASFLAASDLQACIAPLHASYIGAAGDAASLEVLTWALIIL